MKIQNPIKILILILSIGLVFRLVNINQSLWLDEAISVIASQTNSYHSLITEFSPGDFHPPFYYIFLKGWINLFGLQEITLRLLSVIAGLGTVFITFLIGKKLFNTNSGLIASALVSLNPLLIYYSQEVRMYSVASFAVSLCFYFFLRINEKKWFVIIGYILSALLVMYTDYMPIFIFPAQFLYLIIFEKKLLKNFILYLSTGFLLFLPWVLILYKQFLLGIQTASSLPIWSQAVGEINAKSFSLLFVKMFIGRISFENKLIYLSVVAFIFSIYGFLFLRILKKINKSYYLLILWFSVPIIISVVLSFFVPIFSYFRLIYIIPSLLLIISNSISTLPLRWAKLSLLILITFNIFTLYIFNTTPNYQREDWRKAQKISHNIYDDRSVVLFENNEVPAPFKYYNQTLTALPGLKHFPASREDDLIDEKSLKEFDNVILYEYLVDITDPQRNLSKYLSSHGYNLIKTYDVEGVGFIHHYTKLPQ